MDMLKRSKVDKLVEKATNELLIEPDIETTLNICDLVRSQEISAKHVVASVKKRFQSDNANVILHTLYVLEALMKNCGSAVHEEVATRDFMHTFTSLTNISHDVCSQVLTSVQNWAFVFKGKSEYSAIQEAYDELKADGHTFPEFSENDAMFSVVCAPNWKEGSYCHRCKVAFTTFRRRHHCRNCGNSFCAECSSERAMLPKFGIEKEVRVCDHCFELLTRNPTQDSAPKEKKAQLNKDEQARREKERKERELQSREAEELELALALSASEAECKERERRGYSQNTGSTETKPAGYPNIHADDGPMQLLPVLDTSDMDPELARYLNRHYWDNRANALNQKAVSKPVQEVPSASPTLQPSAPRYSSPVPSTSKNLTPGSAEVNEGGLSQQGTNQSELPLSGVPDLTNQKQEEFINALRASIEFFVNRMQSNSQRGRNIANDTTVQALFLTLHEMHPQLLQQKQSMEDRRAYFEEMQDKLTQLREAREALDALRQEHAARRQLEEQEAARLRQLQMLQKLEVMRQQKRDTLEYKRRMALEQTMQYQQQYQSQLHQPPLHQIDPTTGLPLSMSMGQLHPAAFNIPTAGYAMQPGAYLPVATNPVAPVMPTYGQNSLDPNVYPQPDNSAAYQTGAMPLPSNAQPNGQAYYGSQPTVGPTTGQAHSDYNPAVYSMQALDAALPTPPGAQQPNPRAIYHQGQPYGTVAQTPQRITQEPNSYTSEQHLYAELPDPPTTDLRAASPAQSNYGQPRPVQQRNTSEGQLISFD